MKPARVYFAFLAAAIVLLYLPLICSADLTNGLVLHYSFDTDEGSVVTDQSGMGNDGAVYYGASWTSEGKVGGAFQFDGIDDHIRIPGSSDFDITNATVAAWVKPDSYDSAVNQAYCIFDNLAPSFNDGGMQIFISNNRIIFGYRSPGQSTGGGTDQIFGPADNAQWHLVAATYERVGTNSITKLYVDGVLSKTVSQDTAQMTYSGQIMYVGINYDSPAADLGRSHEREFKGLMDELMVYNRVLTPEEVAQIYDESSGNGLILYYPFNSDEGGVVTDQSASGNDGTINGATWTSNGAVGGAMSFDGVDDYVIAVDSPSLRVQQNTIAAWVKPAVTMNGQEISVILSKEKRGAAGGYYLAHGLMSNTIDYKIMEGGLPAQGYYDTTYPLDLEADQWYFIVGTYDGVTRKLYVDGELKTSIDDSITIFHDSQSFYVGSQTPGWSGPPGYCWDGLIDEVRIYNRALTPEEIEELYNKVTLTVSTSYGTTVPSGTTISDLGTLITASVIDSPVAQGPGIQQLCIGWTGAGSVPVSGSTTSVTFTITNDSTIAWNWQAQYELTLAAVNGTITETAAGWKNDGFVYDLLPSPDAGWFLDHWEVNGADVGGSVPLSVTMNGPKSVAAIFVPDQIIDVTALTEASFDVWWQLKLQTGTYFGVLRLENKTQSGKALKNRFWCAVMPTTQYRLMHPAGTLPDGKDYIDITAQVLTALAGTGNGDQVMDPGEFVLIEGIEFYSWDLSEPAGFDYAIWAEVAAAIPDMNTADTDGDGIPNQWEDSFGLNRNNPDDGDEDSDGDGIPNVHEYIADTDPDDPDSKLHISGMGLVDGDLRIEWVGGTGATQYLEWTESLTNPWISIYTNAPPTQITNILQGFQNNGARGFYRIKVKRN